MESLEPTLTDLEVDREASAGERAANADVLQDICKYITFTELKGLRRVCRAWFDVITLLPRMANCTGKFGSDWAREVSGMDYQMCIKFRSVYFRFFQFKRNTVFNPYWNFIGGQNVTKLKFKFARMPCNEMIEFLQGCPNLQEVYFYQCDFNLLEYKIVASRTATANAPSNSHRTCCTHVNGLADLTLVGTPIPPQIHTVQFQGQNFFPLCVLDLLIQRSTGVLRKFGYTEALFIRQTRSRYLPSKDTIEARMQAWISANQETITSFTWFNNDQGWQFLERLTRTRWPAFVRLPNVLEVYIGQKSRKPGTPIRDAWNSYILFLDFLMCCGPNVRTLHVSLTQAFLAEGLAIALEGKVELRTLKLEGTFTFGRNHPHLQVDISEIVGRCPHLETLELWDRNQENHPSMTHNYLPNLPHTLKNLTFFHFYMPIADVATYISSVRAKQLKSLHIESGRLFTNAMMETVIRELPQLEEFGVSNSTFLTDAGLTGLTEKAVRTMITCKSGILSSCNRLETPGGPLKISNLKKLRKLSFAMSNISDISIFLGFKFPELREINLSWCSDVTDEGLIWLARNNPALERVVLMKNRKITHYGLNNLITRFPTIKNIHTSRCCRDRKMGKQLNYVENPRFYRVVSLDKWSDKPPGEL